MIDGGADLSYWRTGQLHHHPPSNLWLPAMAEWKRQNGTESPGLGEQMKAKLDAEWATCQRDYDARVALMMMSEARKHPVTSSDDSGRPPAPIRTGPAPPCGGPPDAAFRAKLFNERQQASLLDYKFPQVSHLPPLINSSVFFNDSYTRD